MRDENQILATILSSVIIITSENYRTSHPKSRDWQRGIYLYPCLLAPQLLTSTSTVSNVLDKLQVSCKAPNHGAKGLQVMGINRKRRRIPSGQLFSKAKKEKLDRPQQSFIRNQNPMHNFFHYLEHSGQVQTLKEHFIRVQTLDWQREMLLK